MKLQVMGTTTAASGIFVATVLVLVLADADAVKDMDMTWRRTETQLYDSSQGCAKAWERVEGPRLCPHQFKLNKDACCYLPDLICTVLTSAQWQHTQYPMGGFSTTEANMLVQVTIVVEAFSSCFSFWEPCPTLKLYIVAPASCFIIWLALFETAVETKIK